MIKTLSLWLLPLPKWRQISSAQTTVHFSWDYPNARKKASSRESTFIGPAHFQEAERSIGNEITLLTLVRRTARVPQAKQAGPVLVFFHLSVWTDHSKSTKQTYQHRSQISTVNMVLIFRKCSSLVLKKGNSARGCLLPLEKLGGLPEWKRQTGWKKEELCKQRKEKKKSFSAALKEISSWVLFSSFLGSVINTLKIVLWDGNRFYTAGKPRIVISRENLQPNLSF